MEKCKLLVLSAALSLLLLACNSPSGNPEKDGQNFCKELVSAAESDDLQQANEIMNTYYNYYKTAPLADRLVFIKTVHDNAILNQSDAWSEFCSKDSFANSSGSLSIDVLYKQTKSEAKSLGVW